MIIFSMSRQGNLDIATSATNVDRKFQDLVDRRNKTRTSDGDDDQNIRLVGAEDIS